MNTAGKRFTADNTPVKDKILAFKKKKLVNNPPETYYTCIKHKCCLVLEPRCAVRAFDDKYVKVYAGVSFVSNKGACGTDFHTL